LRAIPVSPRRNSTHTFDSLYVKVKTQTDSKTVVLVDAQKHARNIKLSHKCSNLYDVALNLVKYLRKLTKQYCGDLTLFLFDNHGDEPQNMKTRRDSYTRIFSDTSREHLTDPNLNDLKDFTEKYDLYRSGHTWEDLFSKNKYSGFRGLFFDIVSES